MKNLSKRFYLILTLLILDGCVSSKIPPSLHIDNISEDGDMVRKIEITWNGKLLVKIPKDLDMCSGFGKKLKFDKDSDFFGPIHIEWENAKGERLIKDFVLEESEWPTIKIRFKDASYHPYVYINFYFTQNDVKYYTSDNLALDANKKFQEKVWEDRRLRCNKRKGVNSNSTYQVIHVQSPNYSNPKIRSACTKQDLELYQLQEVVSRATAIGVGFKKIPQNQRPSANCLAVISNSN